MKEILDRNTIWRIVLLICITLLIVSLIVFGLTFGTIFLILLTIGIVFLFFINRLSIIYERNKFIKTFRTISNISFIIFIISFLLVQFFIFQEINSNIDNQDKVDYVVILGAGLNGDKVSKRLEGRLLKAIEYLKENPSIEVIVSGGQGADEDISEAKAMGRYLIDKGISKDRILYEDQSTSTVENLKYSKEIIIKHMNNKLPKILIVTSDYHMFRAKMISKKLNMESSGIVSKGQLTVKINYLIREYFALVKDWLILTFF